MGERLKEFMAFSISLIVVYCVMVAIFPPEQIWTLFLEGNLATMLVASVLLNEAERDKKEEK